MGNKYWTPEEDEYLREHWGKASLNAIAKTIGRTENAVLCRKEKLHLGAFLDNHPKGAVTLGTICAADVLKRRGINYQRCMKVFAQDLDWKCVYMCYVQLSLFGINAVVVQGDTLSEPYTGSNYPRCRIFRTPNNMGILLLGSGNTGNAPIASR